MSAESRRVVARKNHRCDGCERRNINPGEVYLTGTLFPGDDYYGGKVPYRFKECAYCAERYDRAYLLEPMPANQAHYVYIQAMKAGRG